MPVTLLANQCPIPIAYAALVKLSTAETNTGAGVFVAKPVVSGNTVWASKWNRNAANLEGCSRYGGGLYSVVDGAAKIVLSAGAGLTLNISAGHALIGGQVEIPTATSTAVANGHAGPADRAWIWLTQAGSISITYNTLTPPAGAVVLLGSCTTSGGVITAVDTSGVVYMRGGIPYRETNDSDMPTDSPPATVQFINKGLYNDYFWDGQKYKIIGDLVGAAKDVIAVGDSAYIPTNYQSLYFETLTVYGTLTIAGKVRVEA